MCATRVAVRRRWPTAGEPAAAEVQAALTDDRVRRALHLAVRDRRIRARFATLRAGGAKVAEAVDHLLGPYEDVDGRPYYLSEERVRAVVYRKG